MAETTGIRCRYCGRELHRNAYYRHVCLDSPAVRERIRQVTPPEITHAQWAVHAREHDLPSKEAIRLRFGSFDVFRREVLGVLSERDRVAAEMAAIGEQMEASRQVECSVRFDSVGVPVLDQPRRVMRRGDRVYVVWGVR